MASSASRSKPITRRSPARTSGRRSRRGSLTISATSSASLTFFWSSPSALYCVERVDSRLRTPSGAPDLLEARLHVARAALQPVTPRAPRRLVDDAAAGQRDALLLGRQRLAR